MSSQECLHIEGVEDVVKAHSVELGIKAPAVELVLIQPQWSQASIGKVRHNLFRQSCPSWDDRISVDIIGGVVSYRIRKPYRAVHSCLQMK